MQGAVREPECFGRLLAFQHAFIVAELVAFAARPFLGPLDSTKRGSAGGAIGGA